MLDWLTAERFIRGRKDAFEKVLSAFLAQPNATNFSADSRVQDMPSSVDISYEGLERVLGRVVWDELYQPLRRDVEIMINMPHYTRIIFG